jgi:DNA-binding beta-propeller fold protein YncE
MLRQRPRSISISRSAFLLSSLVLASLFSASCGGSGVSKSGGGGGSSSHLYIADYGNTAGALLQYSVSATAVPTPLSPSSITAALHTDSISVSPLGGLLYAAVDGPQAIGQYLVNPDGSLVANAAPSVGTDQTPGGSTFTHDGKFFVETNFGANSVKAYSVQPDGTLVLTSTAFTQSQPQQVAIDATNSYAYVTNFSSGTVSEFSITANGSLLQTGIAQCGSHPYGLATTGHFLYVCNRNDGTISQYSIAPATGLLTSLGPDVLADLDSSSQPDMVVIDPSGRFAYVVCDGGTTGNAGVTPFKIGTDGKLTRNGSSFSLGIASDFEFVAMDPSGHVLAMVGSGTNFMSTYKIKSDGTLTPVVDRASIQASSITGLAFGP